MLLPLLHCLLPFLMPWGLDRLVSAGDSQLHKVHGGILHRDQDSPAHHGNIGSVQ